MWLWHCGLGFGVICDVFVLVVVIGEAEDGGVCLLLQVIVSNEK
jgi:hypothetical protein